MKTCDPNILNFWFGITFYTSLFIDVFFILGMLDGAQELGFM